MDLLLRLLIAHIITDFFLQSSSWVRDKQANTWRSRSLYLHVFLTGIVAWVFLGEWDLWHIAVLIMVTHYLIDLYKLSFLLDNLAGYVIDQACHIVVLIGVAVYLTDSLDGVRVYLAHLLADTRSLVIISGYLAVTAPVGYLVGKATRRWREDLHSADAERDSLEHAGVWIGILERVLVVTFVLFNQFQAIGFLIAAKSILRFSDKSEDNPRKQTEYVLIGTLISFTIALFVGLLIKSVNSL